jgi:hypothetical protein
MVPAALCAPVALGALLLERRRHGAATRPQALHP